MNQPDSFSFDLYPGLDAELDAAYKRNISAGNASPDVIATAGLSAVVAEAVANQDPLAAANLPPRFRVEIEKARNETVKLLANTRFVTVPELESEDFQDVDWDKLSTGYAAMLGSGLQPEIVVSPAGGSIEVWKSVYSDLPGTKNGGLYINSDVANAWNSLIKDRHGWTIDVVPAAPEPVIKNVSHNMSKVDLQGSNLDLEVIQALNLGQVSTPAELFPDVSTYLTLQAIRLQNGQEPVDASTWTWLKGTFDNNSKAPRAYWLPGVGQVRVRWVGPDGRAGHLGVRPAVRGIVS